MARREIVPKVAAIRKQTAEAFEAAFNSKVREIADKKIIDKIIDISDGGFSAVIVYETSEVYADSVADEFHAEGIFYLCKHCPYFEKPDDRRVKWGTCRYSQFGKAHAEHSACEVLYKDIKAGRAEARW